MSNSGERADYSAYNVEYRSTVDDAWYSVLVILKDRTLTVKLLSFPDTFDETFNADDFDTLEAVEELFKRFRQVSDQVQDTDCYRITKNMTVCATVASKNKDDVRYYDAFVKDVCRKEHVFKNQEEECLCIFLLCWQHGPWKDTLSCCSIADICQIKSCAQVDSRVASFSKTAKEKIRMVSLKSKENLYHVKSEPILSEWSQKMGSARELTGSLQTNEGRAGESYQQIDHDRDMGGGCSDMSSIEETGGHYFMIIEHLEKDLSPSSIIEFIHKQTSITAQAYVFPCLSWESYTRGAVVSNCKEELKKIYDFLSIPDHIIISSKGRPWVMSEKILRHGTLTTLGSLAPKSQEKCQYENIDNVLKVVHKGAEEYKIAKQIKDVVMDFLDHQQRLHRSLEDRMISQPFCAV
ncbi:hypothetical protein LguiA_022880 [Lonicera macranthoides]